MSGLIELLIGILIVLAVLYLIFWVLGRMEMADPARTVIILAVAIVVLVVLVRYLGLF